MVVLVFGVPLVEINRLVNTPLVFVTTSHRLIIILVVQIFQSAVVDASRWVIE